MAASMAGGALSAKGPAVREACAVQKLRPGLAADSKEQGGADADADADADPTERTHWQKPASGPEGRPGRRGVPTALPLSASDCTRRATKPGLAGLLRTPAFNSGDAPCQLPACDAAGAHSASLKDSERAT